MRPKNAVFLLGLLRCWQNKLYLKGGQVRRTPDALLFAIRPGAKLISVAYRWPVAEWGRQGGGLSLFLLALFLSAGSY